MVLLTYTSHRIGSSNLIGLYNHLLQIKGNIII